MDSAAAPGPFDFLVPCFPVNPRRRSQHGLECSVRHRRRVCGDLRRYENVFFQYESGLVDEDFWGGHRENLLWVFRRPGMQRVWKDRKHSFSKSFQEFLERSDSIALATPESRRL